MSSDEPKQNNTDGTSQAARYQINIPDPSIEIRHIGHEFLLKYEASQQENRAYTAKSLFWNRATFCAVGGCLYWLHAGSPFPQLLPTSYVPGGQRDQQRIVRL